MDLLGGEKALCDKRCSLQLSRHVHKAQKSALEGVSHYRIFDYSPIAILSEKSIKPKTNDKKMKKNEKAGLMKCIQEFHQLTRK